MSGGALKFHESTRADGSLSPTMLVVVDDVLHLHSDEGALALPDGALEAVMARFGAPLDTTERVARVAELGLGGRGTLCHIRHLARYDVIARDWLVLEAPGRAPVCALATTVAGALAHLAAAALRARRNATGGSAEVAPEVHPARLAPSTSDPG